MKRNSSANSTVDRSVAVRKLRGDAMEIFQAGLEAVDATRLVADSLSIRGSRIHAGPLQIPLLPNGRIHVFGAGKAAAAMALGVERKLSGRITGGVVITKAGYLAPLKKIQVAVGSHPRSTVANVKATRRLLRSLRCANPQDAVLFVWSGGASALMFQPRNGINFTDKLKTISMLMDAGADIHELNAARKHLSAVKGGQLARCIATTPAISLILSDVCGDNPATIGSGPAFPDDTSFCDVVEILKMHRLWTKIPSRARYLLEKGSRGDVPENPGRGDPIFRNKQTYLVGTSRSALDAASKRAHKLGYRTVVLAQQLQGDTEEAARLHAVVAAAEARRYGKPFCLLSGGETTVRLRPSHGKGGRSQHFTLAAALFLAERKELDGRAHAVLSAGTDGTDGPTDAAGALADSQTLDRCRHARLNPRKFLQRQDSYTFFDRLGDLVIPGPTNTNVMDLRILLVGPKAQATR